MLQMSKVIMVVLILTWALSACSARQSDQTGQITELSAQSNSAGSSNSQSSASPSNATPNAPAGQNLDDMLAIGTLELEGTAQAINSDQAKQLLPLWEQVKSLNTAGNTTPGQIQAVYQQIQAVMTGDQITAIQAMSLSQADLQSLMNRLGIQVTPGMGPGNGQPPAGGLSGTPMAPMGTPGAGNPAARGTPGAPPAMQGTPGAGPAGGPGMNAQFIDPVIKLLQERAGG
jgi:hypothetical protein